MNSDDNKNDICPWCGHDRGKFPPYVFSHWDERLIAPILNGELRKNPLAAAHFAGVPVQVRGAKSAPEKVAESAAFEFISTLRGLVDQWIASGRLQQAECGEIPWERNINFSSSVYPKPIVTTLSEFRERNPPKVFINGDGRFDIFMGGPLRLSAWPSPSPELEDTLEQARDHAIFFFVKLLDSPTRERLFRCDECGTYFVRARMPRKATAISRGAYCPKCKSNGADRARRTKDSRKQRTENMIELAADSWQQWKPDRRHGERAEWVARQVSKRLDGAVIAKNWVTHHRKEIEGRGKNAHQV